MKKKNYVLMLICTLFVSVSFAQFTVKGKVTDKDDKSPLPGVTVVIQNTTRGTITDIDGNYELDIDSMGQTLEFTFIGMEPIRIVTSGSTADISMSAGVDLDEVLIVAYGTADKRTFTGSAGVVSADQLEAAPVNNVISSLQGATSGIQVQSNTGDPGSSNNVKIRGIGSLNSNAQPLYVIDGVQVSSGNVSALTTVGTENSDPSGMDVFSTLNPADIESVTVLKDASATSIYGARAANGVVLITTKKGKAGKAKINVDFKTGISTLPAGRSGYELVGAADIYKLYNDANIVAGVADPNAKTISQLGGSNPYNMDKPYDANGNLNPGASLIYDENWQDQVYRTAMMNEANISVSGGSDKMTYYTSVGYLSQEGIVVGSDFSRASFKNNLNIDLTDYVKMGLNQTLSYSDQNRASGGTSGASSVRNATLYNSAVPVYDYNSSGGISYNQDGTPVYNFDNPVSVDFNPLFTAANDIYNTQIVRSLTSTYLDVSLDPLVDNLTFRTDLGLDYTNTSDFKYYNPFHGSGAAVAGRGYSYETSRNTWTISNKFLYDYDFNKFGKINVLVGQEAVGYTVSQQYAQATDYALFGDQVVSDQLANAAKPQEASSYIDQWTLSSYLARINYSLKDKYYLDLSWRNDGSSRFGPDQRRGNFYSVGASWRISEEAFLTDVSWLDNLKIRGSYGTSGNDQIGYYDYIVNFSDWNYDGNPGYALYAPDNPNLTWEEKVNSTIGIDFEALSHRLGGSVEWYNAGSNNLLYDVPVSMTSGFTSVTQNYASLRNTGIELNLNYRFIETDNWKWDVGVNYTTLNNVITSLPTEENVIGNKIWTEGGSVYDFYLREWAGVDPMTGQPLWNVYDDNGQLSGTTSVYNEATQMNVGTALADGYGGLNTTVAYKNWSLNVNTYLSIGGQIYDAVEQDLLNDGASVGYQTINSQLDAWKNPGDITNVPEFIPGNSSNSDGTSTRYLHDATFFKIKGVMLSYDFNEHIARRLKLSRLGLYLSGNNLFTWTKSDFHGYDPEIGNSGISNYNVTNYKTPNPTTVVMGIRIGL